MTRNSILGYFPYTLFQTLPYRLVLAANGGSYILIPPLYSFL